MKVMEVRCCCHPGKLLGWLQVKDSRLQIPVSDRNGRIGCIELEICGFWNQELQKEYKAIKDNNISIETLRKIRGFVENKE